jgi:hypothetical protein
MSQIRISWRSTLILWRLMIALRSHYLRLTKGTSGTFVLCSSDVQAGFSNLLCL